MLKDKILGESEYIVNSRAADSIEVVTHREDASTIRFANSAFHQGAVESGSTVYIRVIIGRKVGIASVNTLERGALKECLHEALSIAGNMKEEPFEVRFTRPAPYNDIRSYFEETAKASSAELVSLVSSGFRKASSSGILQAGSLTTAAGEIAVVNTNGVRAYHPYTSAFLSSVSSKGEATGFKCATSKNISEIDIGRVMGASAESCLLAQSPRDLKAGSYRVMLEPPAVSELLHWLSYIGFGAKNYQEGTSFLSGRLGEKVTGGNVTIYDDALSPLGMAAPFDMEGAPKRRIAFIEKGIARAVAYDSFTASSEGTESTGHGAFPGENEGPLPDHIFMECGDKTYGEMLESLGTGLLIKSFHYVNGLLSPRETLMTGMTRHGTFYVKDGKIEYPVRPLRFMENIIKAFNRIELVSKDAQVFPNHGFPLSSVTAPCLLINGFRFTG
ncbi:MAG: TldD/PmbA family protein [Deltaproteobacteria bacterium]|nr:TldD/PmbA family protein [Deltaproteobacteria bacterium]